MVLRKNLFRLSCNLLCLGIIILLLLIYNEKQIQKTTLLTEISVSANKFILFKERETQHLDIQTLQRLIKTHNEAERIHNKIKFGPVFSDTNVIVVFVYKISEHLKYLIASLNDVKGIQDVLVIFSHAYYDVNINKLIEKIDFCRVLQIFYPYSIQLYPNVYPGRDKFYISNISAHRACLGCCIERSPENAEKKHHWWWTANKVFENLSSIDMNNGNYVFFLDETQYLLEDFLYMVIYMKKAAKSLSQCDMISLGIVGSNYVVNDSYRLELTTWDPKYHSDVLGFGLGTWNIIVSHFDLFCLIDDYSWSRSLQYISLNRLEGNRFKVISSKVPRSFATNCGSRSVTNCGVFEGIYKALTIQKQERSNLFPPFLEIYTIIELVDDDFMKFDATENNGGWDDIRDSELCSNMTSSKVKKLLLDMKTQFS